MKKKLVLMTSALMAMGFLVGLADVHENSVRVEAKDAIDVWRLFI